MASAQSEDVARRGTHLYEQRLRALLEPTHSGRFIAIEPDSGEYFVGDTDTEWSPPRGRRISVACRSYCGSVSRQRFISGSAWHDWPGCLH